MLLLYCLGSPFTEKLDRFVMRIYDTGLVHKIEVQVRNPNLKILIVTLDDIGTLRKNVSGHIRAN